MNFCSACGTPVSFRIPEGDMLPRYMCDACGAIHYLNPKIVVGCIAQASDRRILLCRRSIEPRAGFWTMPAGFMENGETIRDAALRETQEEACARVEIAGLSSVVSVLGADQVHVMYHGRLVDDAFAAGDETLEAALVDEAEMPWDTLAFRSVTAAFKLYFEDRRRGVFETHHVDLPPLR
ncbi:MAG: NUDIX hydrolase [Xanthomonadaceae bacterium]|nr:NUDIX hydrolase [Xanthomonadaceae bacterium]